MTRLLPKFEHDIDVIAYSSDRETRDLILQSVEASPIKSALTPICNWDELQGLLERRRSRAGRSGPDVLVFSMDHCSRADVKLGVEHIRSRFAGQMYLIGMTRQHDAKYHQDALDFGVNKIVSFVDPISVPRKLSRSIMTYWFDHTENYYLD